MKKISLLLLLVKLLTPSLSLAQSYFQQEVNYKIEVTLDDEKHELTAFESISYTNNSPDSLGFIYFHLWPNAYKNHNTALAKQLLARGEKSFYYSEESERGFIDSLDFKINNEVAKWEVLTDSIDICKLYLNEPLKSGKTITITTPFHVKIPSGKISRLGHLEQSYQITQWYPKPAVYDKGGWHQMSYLNQGEFYSEFGSFDVSISLPQNYVVGATGDLVNEKKELEWLDKKVDETKAIKSFDATDMTFPASSEQFKTLNYKQENVHDFAWFCDKRYHVLKGEVTTPNTNQSVTLWSMFTNSEAHLWQKSIEYMTDAIHYYSLWNGDYPYKQCTAVDGTLSAGAGMEYPNITVIGEANSAFYLDLVLAHEIGHNWFYGILGSNERMYPWLDEGINSYNENRYIETMYPNYRLIGERSERRIGKLFDLADYKHKKEAELMYQYSATKNQDQPVISSSDEFTSWNYGAIVYSKTALIFDYLLAYVGKEKMDIAMHYYYETWKFKHPSPSDFRECIETSLEKDLSWLFDDLLTTTKKLDYKITSANYLDNGSWQVEVKNTGDINGPVILQGMKNDSVRAYIVYDGFEGKRSLGVPGVDVDYFTIDYQNDMPEINRNNNIIRKKGILKKVEPIKFQFLGSLDNPKKSQLFYSPVAGWNNYNQAMFGMIFHNVTIPQHRFEYQLMPMYSLGSKDLAGYGDLKYHLYPKRVFIQHLSLGVSSKRYAYAAEPIFLNFNKIAPELNINFKKKKATSNYNHHIRFRNILLIEDEALSAIDITAAGIETVYTKSSSQKNFNALEYIFSKDHVIQPYSFKLDLLQGENIIKSSITAKYSYNYKRKNKSFDVRLFAGTFIGTDATDAGAYRFRLSGQRGYQDYLYDDIFLGRTETDGILANQFTDTDGAFKFYSPVGQSSQWLTSLNLKSSLGNLKLPLNIYADFGVTAIDGRLNDILQYNAGISIPIVKDFCEVYFPLLISEELENYKDANGLKYIETIRFTLNLNLLNPFEAIKNVD